MGNKKKIGSVFFVAILVFSIFATIPITTASPDDVIYVPDDYPTIQEAVNAASDGDTIIVRNGTYYENVVLNKTLTLQGEDMPMIDAQAMGHAIEITSSNCAIRGFRIVNASRDRPYWNSGIKIEWASNLIIEDNIIENNSEGIRFVGESDNNMIRYNKFCKTKCIGIRNPYVYSTNNTIVNNKFYDSGWWGIQISGTNHVISNNTCENSDIALYASNSELTNNTFRDCGVSVGNPTYTYNNEIVPYDPYYCLLYTSPSPRD